MEPGVARNPMTELRRGVLESCVLALVRDEEAYAFDIVRTLSAAGSLLTSEGTIYPLLARLRRDGLAMTSWRESASGPPRRYYRDSWVDLPAVRRAGDRPGLHLGSRQWTTREKAIATLIVAVIIIIPLLGLAAVARSGA